MEPARDSVYLFLVQPPIVDLVDLGLDTLLCVNDSTLLDASNPGANYLWFNNGTDSIYVVFDSGAYWVEVTNACGVASDSILVDFDDTLQVNLGIDTTICIGDSLLLTGIPGNGLPHFWQDGTTGTVYLVTIVGQYWVLVSNVCGAVSDTIVINFRGPPTVDLGADQLKCTGDPVILTAGDDQTTQLWSTGATSDSVTLTQTDTYAVSVTNACGTASDSVNLVFEDTLTLELGDNKSGCVDDGVWLTAQANQPVPLTWSDGTTNDSLLVVETGPYWIQGSNVCGTVRDSILVTILPLPYLDLVGDSLFCDGDSVQLAVNNLIGISTWLTGVEQDTFTANTTGWVWAEANNPCGQHRDSLYVRATPLPYPALAANQQVCPDEPVTLKANINNVNLQWEDGSTSATRILLEAGMYYVWATDSFNCQAMDSIELFPCATIWVPNAFTPNSDGKNDVFKPDGEGVTEYRFQVFSRWGELLFETTDFAEGWDGTIEGERAPVGQYTWRVDYLSRELRYKFEVGSVSLIR